MLLLVSISCRCMWLLADIVQSMLCDFLSVVQSITSLPGVKSGDLLRPFGDSSWARLVLLRAWLKTVT